jgi:hypothetical protein
LLNSAFLIEDYKALLDQCGTIDIPDDITKWAITEPETLPLLLDNGWQVSLSHNFFIKAIAHMQRWQTLKFLLVKGWHLPVTEDMIW